MAVPVSMDGAEREEAAMPLLRASEPATEQVPPGLWPAVVTGVEEGPDGEYGKTLKWRFNVQVGDRVLAADALSGQNVSSMSKAGKWIGTLTGRPVVSTDEIDTDSLIGRYAQVHVEAQPDSAWTRIVNLLPMAQPVAAAPVAAPAPSPTPVADVRAAMQQPIPLLPPDEIPF